MKDNPLIFKTPRLPISHFQLLFGTEQPTSRLPVYSGSAWRGAFGHALKKTVCIVRDTSCQECMLKSSCAYSYIFETPLPAKSEKMRKYNAAPHPFVLQLPEQINKSEHSFDLGLILFGHAMRFFPYLVHAFQKAGADGIGGNRQPFKLERIEQILTDSDTALVYQDGKLAEQGPSVMPQIPPMPTEIKLIIHTPLRIKQNGKNLNGKGFNFGAFFGNLLRRVSMLTYFHTDTPLETDFKELMQRAREVSINTENLQWFDWKRYSSRQKTEMNMGGVVGSIHLDMQGLEMFWSYLWLGQWTHAGKGTSMGMGAYTLKAASLPIWK